MGFSAMLAEESQNISTAESPGRWWQFYSDTSNNNKP